MDHGEVPVTSDERPGTPTPLPFTAPPDAALAPILPEAPAAPGLETTSPPALPCANCATPLTGPFCAQCGQHVADYHRSVWRFVADFFDNTFCWDNKLLRTLVPLFRRPGSLTVEFMAGRRVRYVHPLRLFLFTSAVCLTLLHFGSPATITVDGKKHRRQHAAPARNAVADADDPDDAADADDDQPPSAANLLPAAPPSAAPSASPTPPPDASPPASPAATPPDRAALKAAVRDALKDKLGDRDAGTVTELGDRIVREVEKGGADRIGQAIMDGVWNRLSWVALAMLPVFALMLRGLYWRSDSDYFLHLVFSLHYHTFLLLFWTAYSFLSRILDGSPLHFAVTLGLLAPPVYLFLSLRRVYGDGVPRTWMKVALLGGMHLLAIVSALGAIGALAVFSAIR